MGTPEARHEVVRWLAAAACAAIVCASTEVLFVTLAFRAAASDPVGLAAWWALSVAIVALPSMVLALLVAASASRVRPRLPQPAVLVWGLLAAVLAGEGVAGLDAYVASRSVQDFPERLAFAKLPAAFAIAGLAIVVARAGYASTHAWIGRWRASRVLAGVACVAGLYALAVVELGLGPIHMRPLSVGGGVVALVLLMLSARLLVSARASPALAALLCVLVVGPVLTASRNPHARFVVFNHAPIAGPIAAALRDALDQDGDGSPSAWLGGVDCDDADPARGPALREIAGDGVDQDCRGGDAPRRAPAVVAADLPQRCTLPSRPSILLVTVDAFRADHFDARVTPHMARLRERAFWFTRAYAATTLTRSAFPSLFAGRPCSAFASANPAVDQRATLGRTLMDALRDGGYRTIGLNYFETPRALAGEFDEFDRVFLDPLPGALRHGRRAASLTNGVLATVAQAPEPWFLWVHYPDAHAPYVGDAATPAARYAEELSYVDLHVGRLVAGLAERGRLRDTVVVITADHGEALGEGGHEGHGPNLLEGTIHVPLAVYVPGCAPSRVTTPVSVTALAGTLEALVGVRAEGPTLFTRAEPRPAVVTEAIMLPSGELLRSYVEGDEKLLIDVRNGGRMLFDLARDPHESRDLFRTHRELRERLEQGYQRWLDALPGT